MKNSQNKFKDALPAITIGKIRQLLSQLDLFAFEKEWHQLNHHCYSVRVEIDGFPGIGMNGKGTSRLYALASAYGEILERLQNKTLFPRKYGIKDKLMNSFADEKLLDFEEFKKNKRVFESLTSDIDHDYLKVTSNQYNSLSLGLPFYELGTNKIEYLPSRLLGFACGTNGMCSGNTPEEALSHGICEILERYVTKQLILEELLLPSISLNNIKNTSIISTKAQLEHLGYEVIVKDCTLNGKFPVIGLLLINPDKTGYIFKIGSDAVFEIALERCFTEMFQGFSISRIENNMLPIDWAYHKKTRSEKINDLANYCKNGSGQLPLSIFQEISPNISYATPFLESPRNNKEILAHLVTLLKQEDQLLYIRDLSFLGLPTYKLYIPSMSEIYLQDEKSISKRFDEAQAIRVLLNISKATKDEINLLIEVLKQEKELFIPVYKSTLFGKLQINISTPDHFMNLPVIQLLVLTSCKVKDYTSAYTYLNQFLAQGTIDASTRRYYQCALAYLKYKSDKQEQLSIRNSLESLFGNSLANEVIDDLHNPNTAFKYVQSPTCPDCDTCSLKTCCNYPKWTEVSKKLNSKAESLSYWQNRVSEQLKCMISSEQTEKHRTGIESYHVTNVI